jgi:hypothetical protein
LSICSTPSTEVLTEYVLELDNWHLIQLTMVRTEKWEYNTVCHNVEGTEKWDVDDHPLELLSS